MIDYNSIVLSIIKKHRNFSSAINQHQIAKVINDSNWRGEGYDISSRAVRKMIEELIRLGNPIISTPVKPGGYCYQGEGNEYLECVNRLRKKAAKIFIRARRIKHNCQKEKAKIENTEQLNIFAKQY